jgi:hypothetical protein
MPALDKLRKLATDSRWLDVREWLDRPSSQSHIDETPAVFEEVGDENAAAGAWADALHCYHFGLEPAKRRRESSAGPDDVQVVMRMLQLQTKLSSALLQIPPDDDAFAKSVAQEIIALAKQKLTGHAEELLGWIRGPKQYAICGSEFEFAADELVRKQRKSAVWLFQQADKYYRAADMDDFAERVHRRLDEIQHPPPPPAELKKARKDQAKLDVLYPKLEALAHAKKSVCCMLEIDYTYKELYPRISAHFEALGEQLLAEGDPVIARHMYVIAASTGGEDRGRLSETLQRLMHAEIDDMIAHPVVAEPVPDPLTWDNGLPYIHRLILAGRFSEGGALFSRLKKKGDDYYDRFIDTSNTFVWIGDHVASTHPKAARWFYQKAYNDFANFAGSAYGQMESDNRWQTANEIKAKLDSLG